MTRQKILLIIFTLFLTASCTRVRNKVVDWLSTSSNFEEYHVSQLYPSLGQDGDCGVCEEWPLYNMWFRYQGTPAQVESAIIAKECSYTEIKPDSAFISCDRNYIWKSSPFTRKSTFLTNGKLFQRIICYTIAAAGHRISTFSCSIRLPVTYIITWLNFGNKISPHT